jgi:hypothetical protein
MPNIFGINVTVPSESWRRGAALEELDKSLKAIPTAGYAEIWVNHDSFPALCVLVNGEQSWLMCLRFSGDAGFSSRNPSFVGKPDTTLEYYLSNGQRDIYPAAWAYPTKRALEAVSFFAERRQVPDWIGWFNDSEDGTASPNDEWKEQV